MHFSPSKSANSITDFMGTALLLALLGGFLSDTFVTTYVIYLISAVIEFLWHLCHSCTFIGSGHFYNYHWWPRIYNLRSCGQKDPTYGKMFETIDPRTGEVIARIAEGDKEEVDLAVTTARDAFDNGPWPRFSGFTSGENHFGFG
ncbi:Aldehyde dehydrogenase (NAD(P)(+)) [Bertholletia excelsa]